MPQGEHNSRRRASADTAKTIKCRVDETLDCRSEGNGVYFEVEPLVAVDLLVSLAEQLAPDRLVTVIQNWAAKMWGWKAEVQPEHE